MERLNILIESFCYKVNNFIWSPLMLSFLLGTGLYLSFHTNFLQITKFKFILNETIIKTFKQKEVKSKSGITPFQAVTTALAGTIGTGNIVGVATAITLAGPGAVFWMWVSSILGMMIKYSEIVLAIKFRKKNKEGEWIGGPMVYISKGLKLKKLASIYALFAVFASFGIGNMAQANAIAKSMDNAFNFNPISTGIILSILIGITIFGGIKQISRVAEKIVPFMSIFYTGAALIVIFANFYNLPNVFKLIIKSAFTPFSQVGGALGTSLSVIIQKGISRGIFTNEAGLGSASIAHACVDIKNPARQGLWGIFEVFFDTILMCSISAFAILVTNVSLSDPNLTTTAFDSVLLGYGKYIIALSLAFFAFSSILAWSFYGVKCVEFLVGDKGKRIYLSFFTIAIVIGASMNLNLVWNISDAFNGLMIIPNLIGIIGLRKVIIDETKAIL